MAMLALPAIEMHMRCLQPNSQRQANLRVPFNSVLPMEART